MHNDASHTSQINCVMSNNTTIVTSFGQDASPIGVLMN